MSEQSALLEFVIFLVAATFIAWLTIRQAVAIERERCAWIAETMREDLGMGPVTDDGYKMARCEIADKIRSGKNG